MIENAESTFKSKSSVKNLNCKGDVCIADSDLLSDGATTVCVELKNQLSEELEPNVAFENVAISQDGARSDSILQITVTRHVFETQYLSIPVIISLYWPVWLCVDLLYQVKSEVQSVKNI